MNWIIGIAFAIFIYFVFFRKSENRATIQKHVPDEIVICVERSDTPDARKIDPGNAEEEKDNWEKFDYCNARLLPAKGNYKIIYEDQSGLKTERDIKVKRVHECGGNYSIDAHCILRNSHRSFLGERIRNAINLDSGEIVKNLALDAIAQYGDSGEGRALSAIDKEWMGVAVLVFVCRADGQMRKAERAIVSEYLKKYCTDVELDDAELDSAIKALGTIDHKEFKSIIRDLKTTGKHDRLTDLCDCAKRIVATQKTVDPIEKAALEILEDAAA